MIKQKLSDYQQSMYNFFSPTATFIAVCAIAYALIVKGIFVMPKITGVDIFIMALASFRLIRFFCFDSMFGYVRDRISYHIKVVEEGDEAYVTKTPVGPGYRRLLTNLLDCVWCVGIWTTLATFILYVASAGTAMLVMILAIAGVATFFQLLASLVATHYEACDLKNDEMRKTLGK
ncbi:MAG: hypothetical protein RLY57_377 [Candidatus Parcubacteria bacterium]|jgi:xanthine/uracil/vitamin C permease (AzgA family)